MEHKHMVDGAHAQVEILDENDELLALASFYWDYDMCWTDFTARVVRASDRMYAEFDDGNATQYIKFKTGGEKSPWAK